MDSTKLQKEEEKEFNAAGRMKYHPGVHFNHGQPFTQAELEYLCKYVEFDGMRAMSYALGRTEAILANKVSKLKKQGLYEYYKNLNKHW